MRSAFLLPLFTIAVSFAQTPPPSQDTQLTQALLAELRSLRQDLQATAATIQRVQLVMFRMQTAAQTLNRATQRLDDTRNRCGYIQPQRKSLTNQIEQSENRQRSAPTPTDTRVADEVTRLKSTLEMLTVQEQQCQSNLIDVEAQLRTEQAKMNELQDQFDKLDRALADVSRK
jgi:chromosome segregation ATPase